MNGLGTWVTPAARAIRVVFVAVWGFALDLAAAAKEPPWMVT